jgi:hypothetical protein
VSGRDCSTCVLAVVVALAKDTFIDSSLVAG